MKNPLFLYLKDRLLALLGYCLTLFDSSDPGIRTPVYPEGQLYEEIKKIDSVIGYYTPPKIEEIFLLAGVQASFGSEKTTKVFYLQNMPTGNVDSLSMQILSHETPIETRSEMPYDFLIQKIINEVQTTIITSDNIKDQIESERDSIRAQTFRARGNLLIVSLEHSDFSGSLSELAGSCQILKSPLLEKDEMIVGYKSGNISQIDSGIMLAVNETSCADPKSFGVFLRPEFFRTLKIQD